MTLEDYLREKSISKLKNHALIGEILLRRGQIRQYQLNFALELQSAYKKYSGQKQIGEILLQHRALSPVVLREALSIQKEIPHESVTQIVSHLKDDDGEHTKLIPPSEAK